MSTRRVIAQAMVLGILHAAAGCGGPAAPNPVLSSDASCVAPPGGHVTEVARGPQGVQQVVLDAVNAYWITSEVGAEPVSAPNGAVLQCARVGCASPTMLASAHSPAALTVAGERVYWTDAYGVMSVPVGGGSTATVSASQAVGLSADDDSLYWSTVAGSVVRASIHGGSESTLASPGGAGGLVAVNSRSVYWTSATLGLVMSAPKAGGALTTIAVGQAPSALAVAADDIYWVNADNGTMEYSIVHASTTGATVSTLVSGVVRCGGVAVGSQALYWAAENGVMAIATCGGVVSTLFADTSRMDVPFAIAVDGTAVYWVDAISGTLMRLSQG